MKFYFDAMRHLVCYPYSVAGLHEMALKLKIKRCWFHEGRFAHYDIPKKLLPLFLSGGTEATQVRSRQILEIVKGGHPPTK